MPTNVVMPQMGESVAEGTVVRWIKKLGERVDRDEPLLEISTDKVDAEIPSPAAGVVKEIRVKEGETVPVDSIVAVIASAGEVAVASKPADEPEPSPAPAAAPAPAAPTAEADGAPPDEALRDHRRRTKSSPLVRRIAQEHDIDISSVQGSGASGRVTKQDILHHLDAHLASHAAPAAPAPGSPPVRPRPPAFEPGDRVEIVPMSVMRKKIAEHMTASVHTSAHVYSVFEIDFHQVSQIRDRRKAAYEQLGAKLTFTAFIARAVCEALRAVPVVNASIDDDRIVYKKEVNLGIAVALDAGLIVPVIRNADEKNLLGLCRGIADLADRARSKQLKPDEVHGGTFTITNPGTFGTLLGMPIINQPQVAILAVGAIEKRVAVIGEAIHVRPRAYFTLGYDHRLIDGAVADQFMARVKRSLEEFDAATV